MIRNCTDETLLIVHMGEKTQLVPHTFSILDPYKENIVIVQYFYGVDAFFFLREPLGIKCIYADQQSAESLTCHHYLT